MDPLHFIFTDFPGPENQCRLVDLETPDGKSVSAGEWRTRADGYVELVIPSALPARNDNDPKVAIAREIYKALEKLGASPELLGTVGSYGDTLTDEAVLAHLKRFNEKGTIFDEVICRADWRVVDG
jgi:hypothetical protein